MEQARKELPDIEYCDDPYECARGADALVIVTEWVQFRALDLASAEERDGAAGRGGSAQHLSPEDMAAHGFTYESVGRGA